MRKGRAVGDLVFYPKGIKSLKFESGSPILELNLGIANTANQSFDINAIAGNLYTNDTYIGYISNFLPIKIPARSETILPIKIRLSLIGLVSQLIEGLQNATWTQNLVFDFNTNIDNLVLPQKITYKIGK